MDVEIGDLCTSLNAVYNTTGDGGAASWVVQRFWSEKNAAAATLDPCVPVPDPPYVYFNAALDPDQFVITLDENGVGSAVLNIEPFAISDRRHRREAFNRGG